MPCKCNYRTSWGHIGRIPNSVLGDEIRLAGRKLYQNPKDK